MRLRDNDIVITGADSKVMLEKNGREIVVSGFKAYHAGIGGEPFSLNRLLPADTSDWNRMGFSSPPIDIIGNPYYAPENYSPFPPFFAAREPSLESIAEDFFKKHKLIDNIYRFLKWREGGASTSGGSKEAPLAPDAKDEDLSATVEKTSTVKYDPIKAVERLKKNYQPESIGQCARYVRWAIETGMGREVNGPNTLGFPIPAKLYGADLVQKVGYKKLNFTPNIPNNPEELQKGDIMIFQPHSSPEKAGHIQMWDGEKWGSDFKQPADDFWPSRAYKQNNAKFEFFRYLIVLIFMLIGLVNAQNTNVDKAKNLLDTLYKSTIFSNKQLNIGNKKETSKYFSSEMAELLYLEVKCRKETGELCQLDSDIICNCQDNSPKFSATFKIQSIEPIQIIVKISDIGLESELWYNFVEENGTLKISDIILDGKYSLKNELRDAYLKP